jgi:hypothetical protein
MYKIIGGDEREYGPVTADQIREWIDEGRANGATQVQAEGEAEWKALANCPEFAEALAGQASALASRTLPPFGQTARGSLDDCIRRAGTLDLGSCFARSWDLLKRNFWLLVGASALIFIISIGMEFIPMVGQIAGTVLSMVLWGGLDWMVLKMIRGQPVKFSDAFAGFQIGFLQLMLAGIVTSVLILVGFFLCILPGIYLMVAWLGFSPLLIMDKQMDFWPALELSRRVVTANFWNIFALFLLSLVAFVGGLLALGVGVFVALPLATGAVVYAYEDIFNPPST